MKIIKTTDTHYGHNEKTHKVHMKFFDLMAKKIEEEKITTLIHPGDWISTNQHELKRTWKMFRDYFPDIDILGVRGNHDLWNYEVFGVHPKKAKWAKLPLRSIQEMYKAHEEWAEEYNIHLLQKNPFEKEGVTFYGFDGWYAMPNASNDKKFMPSMVESCPSGSWLLNQAYSELDTILEMAKYNTDKKVLVTHMPPHHKDFGPNMLASMNASERWIPFMTPVFDVVCFGHTHFPCDVEIDGCRFINAGTDYLKNHGYNNPKFKIFEI